MAEGTYDVVILGSGTGGYACALRAAELGKRVAVIERDDRLGGTCLLRGCIPSKALLDSSHGYWLATHGEEHGIMVQGASFSLPKAVARKDAVVKQLVGGIELLLKARKVDLLTGTGTLVSPGELKVKVSDGERSVKANAITEEVVLNYVQQHLLTQAALSALVDAANAALAREAARPALDVAPG